MTRDSNNCEFSALYRISVLIPQQGPMAIPKEGWKDQEDREKCYEMLSPRHDMDISLMRSWQTKSVKIPTLAIQPHVPVDNPISGLTWVAQTSGSEPV